MVYRHIYTLANTLLRQKDYELEKKSNLLPLPIDHRYNLIDVQRVSTLLLDLM